MRALVPVLLAAACCTQCTGQSPTPCDDVGQRKSVITAQEYRVCAKATLAALDALRPPVQAFVDGRREARDEALTRYNALQLLLKRSGVQREFQNVLYAPGRVAERWPDHRLLTFNERVWWAGFHYHVALEVGEHIPPSYNEEYFDKATQAHDEARSAYEELW